MDVTVIKAKKGTRREWTFVALDRGTPRFIFPVHRVSVITVSDEGVTFNLRVLKNMTIPISIKFDDSAIADKFFKFLIEKL